MISNPWKGWVFIKVLTSNGKESIGEATHYFGQRAVKSIYRDVKEFILGEDPFKVEKIGIGCLKKLEVLRRMRLRFP